MNRRQFLSRTLASAAAVPFTRLSCLPTRLDLRASLPNPAIGWHGQSAFSMATRATLEAEALLERQRRNPSPDRRLRARRGRSARSVRRRSPPALRLRVLPLVRHESVASLGPVGTEAAARPRVHLPAAARRLRLARPGGASNSTHGGSPRAGAGAINISWWGPGSFEDRAVPLIMDVMRDHDIARRRSISSRTAIDRVTRYAEDVLYLLREYGEKRHWDAFLLLEDASGHVGPGPEELPDDRAARGPRLPRPDLHRARLGARHRLAPADRRGAGDAARRLRRRSPCSPTSATSSGCGTAGFDGMAIYDNYVRPSTWRSLARACSSRGQVFSFNTNPGFDGIHLRTVEPDSCYVPSSLEPGGRLRLVRAAGTGTTPHTRASPASPSRLRRRSACRRTPASATPGRILPRVHQLVQRVARGPPVRADARRRRAHRRRSGTSGTTTRARATTGWRRSRTCWRWCVG